MKHKIVIATFYKFVTLNDCETLQKQLHTLCTEQGVFGTILLAEEGINSTIAGTRSGMDAILNFLRADSRFSDLVVKESFTDSIPFKRVKVKIKPEIVTFRASADPNQQVGTYVEPDNWNELIADPDVIVIDTRNHFEVEVGTFQRAISPRTDSFTEFSKFVGENLDTKENKKIAMFCTGGIRCEKATSYMIEQGFEDVYHLKGGILRYLEMIDPEQSLWEGECFVFDERVSVNHHLEPGKAEFCKTCKTLLIDGTQPCSECGTQN